MDRTDYQILNILQADCRATLKCIGDQVGLTAPAVSERVRRMEEKGVIRDFRIDIDRARLDSGMTGIISHYHVIGVFNALLRFAVRGTRELDELLSAIKRYGDSQTSVELKTYFESKDIPMPE